MRVAGREQAAGLAALEDQGERVEVGGEQLGVRGLGRSPGPRLHDLRHTFAVRSLEACGHDRQAVASHMLALSTYLGHTEVAHTYWYLQATPVLLRDIAAVSEQLFQGHAA